MRRLIGAACLCAVLSGCMSPALDVTGTRDSDVAMSSIATVDLQKLSGRWNEVLAYVPDGASCVLGGVTFTRQNNGIDLTVTEGPCADGTPQTGLAKRIGPGRFAFKGDELWILWVDATYDTAILGYPSGQAHVLSRDLVLPPDRKQAVEGILSWNGYDLASLKQSRRR